MVREQAYTRTAEEGHSGLTLRDLLFLATGNSFHLFEALKTSGNALPSKRYQNLMNPTDCNESFRLFRIGSLFLGLW